jgi:hypothetical protein
MRLLQKHPLLMGAASLVVMTAVLWGCKNFLTDAAPPEGTLNQSTLENLAGVEGTLIGAYRALDCTSVVQANWGCAASDWVWGNIVGGDSYKGSDATDQPPINDIEGHHWSTQNAGDYLNQKWVLSYEGIVRANSTINLLKSVLKNSPSAITTADAHSIEGEAIFLRVHYSFEAWKMWGNVPYYRDSDQGFNKPNETADLVAADMLKDLDSAIKLLPATPRNGQKGRATSWTAKAYKGRIQAYMGKYSDAVATLSDVVASGPYALEKSFDRVWTGFSDYANGPETIWAYQASANDGEPNGNNANYGERLNFPYSGSHFGCCGFNPPSQNLVNFFRVDGNGLPLALSDPDHWNVSDANFTSKSTDPVDPRLDWTVGRDSVPFKDWGLYSIAAGWVRDIGNGGPYSPKKNIHEKASGAESNVGWQNTQLNAVNIHLFRYADLLLLLAESMVETNNLEGARQIVNQIRTRAGQTAQGPGTSRADLAVPINDPRITWAHYTIGLYPSFPTQAYARAAVRAERRLELAMEGQHTFDLRRWGVFDTEINGYVNGIGGGAEKNRRLYLAAAEPITARHRWFPIPDIQISLSSVGGQPALKQNTGW